MSNNKNIYYKAFNKNEDGTLSCKGMVYKEGEIYEMDDKPEVCGKGFHFCKDLVLTLSYYPIKSSITENAYAEVELLGDVDWEMPTRHKGATNKIKIVRVLDDSEVEALVDHLMNSGDYNSGDRNSGDYNSGNNNSGNYNSGNCNSGNCNSGHCNSGYRNSGNSNSGDRNSGNSNSGNHNSGYRNSGYYNSGNYNSGNYNSGYRNSGDRNSGNYNSGDHNSGDRNSGGYNSGDCNSGDYNSGYYNSGHCNSGYRNSGDDNSGDDNSGDYNSGDYNSGGYNSGYRNSGDRNSGNYNSGDHNSGDYNSGHYNSGNYNSCNNSNGFFNTREPEYVDVFNKPCKREDWEEAVKPSFLFFDLDPDLGYKGSFKKAFEEADEKDRALVVNLPNFDYDVFEEISGIDLKEYNL